MDSPKRQCCAHSHNAETPRTARSFTPRPGTINTMDSNPIHDGPRPPDSVPAPPEHRVQGPIPYVHVDDVDRSIAFYQQLGFTMTDIYRYRQRSVWAALRSEGAELMVSVDGDPIDPAGQGVLFYLYAADLAALRVQLLEGGLDAGEIFDGTPAPRQQLKLTDPDGYVLMIAQIEPEDD